MQIMQCQEIGPGRPSYRNSNHAATAEITPNAATTISPDPIPCMNVECRFRRDWKSPKSNHP